MWDLPFFFFFWFLEGGRGWRAVTCSISKKYGMARVTWHVHISCVEVKRSLFENHSHRACLMSNFMWVCSFSPLRPEFWHMLNLCTSLNNLP